MPPPPPPPPRRRLVRPRLSLGWVAVFALVATIGLVAYGWSLLPERGPGQLRAPVARAVEEACTLDPASCGLR